MLRKTIKTRATRRRPRFIDRKPKRHKNPGVIFNLAVRLKTTTGNRKDNEHLISRAKKIINCLIVTCPGYSGAFIQTVNVKNLKL